MRSHTGRNRTPGQRSPGAPDTLQGPGKAHRAAPTGLAGPTFLFWRGDSLGTTLKRSGSSSWNGAPHACTLSADGNFPDVSGRDGRCQRVPAAQPANPTAGERIKPQSDLAISQSWTTFPRVTASRPQLHFHFLARVWGSRVARGPRLWRSSLGTRWAGQPTRNRVGTRAADPGS
jgi:hypothetical protein